MKITRKITALILTIGLFITFAVAVSAEGEPVITTINLPEGEVGINYAMILSAEGEPVKWSLDGDLPDGLAFSGGMFAGMPTVAGTFEFTVRAENSSGFTEKEFVIVVSESSDLYEAVPAGAVIPAETTEPATEPTEAAEPETTAEPIEEETAAPEIPAETTEEVQALQVDGSDDNNSGETQKLPQSGKLYVPLPLLITVGALGLVMVFTSVIKSKHRPRAVLSCVGILAILSSTGVGAYSYWDDSRADNSVSQTTKELSGQIEQQEVADEDTPLIEINGEFYIGMLKIPSLNLELPVNSEWNDDAMKDSPCRYTGDISDSIIIVAHNYKAHFGQIPYLSYGDELIITDANGKDHYYTVELSTVLNETEIDAMVNNPYDLTLFTCTLDRRNRVTVRCNKVESAEQTPVIEAEDSPAFPDYEITQGQLGGNVKLIQRYINAISAVYPEIPSVDEDSSFGPATKAAVQKFQKLYGLSVDGVVGPITWDKLVTVYNDLN